MPEIISIQSVRKLCLEADWPIVTLTLARKLQMAYTSIHALLGRVSW